MTSENILVSQILGQTSQFTLVDHGREAVEAAITLVKLSRDQGTNISFTQHPRRQQTEPICPALYVDDTDKVSQLLTILQSVNHAPLVTVTAISVESLNIIHHRLLDNHTYSTLLHHEQQETERDEILGRLRNGDVKILLTT